MFEKIVASVLVKEMIDPNLEQLDNVEGWIIEGKFKCHLIQTLF
ncbi:hypothetical protein ACVPPR_08930 [Dellaglioa sp. L3N]